MVGSAREWLIRADSHGSIAVRRIAAIGAKQSSEAQRGRRSTRAVRVDVPLADGKTLAWIYSRGEVLGRRDDSEAAHISVRLSDTDLGRLRHRQRVH